MSKILVVFGATGNQGGSVINHVVNDSELSKTYTVRAVTRDVSSSKAKALTAMGCEVVIGDSSDKDSLHKVFKGAYAAYALTVTNYAGAEGHSEIEQGRNIVDAAIAENVQFLVWSTLPYVSKISGGKYTKVASFDAKAEIETYIRSKSIKSAFFSPGSFMQNFATITKPHPNYQANDGSFVIARPVKSTAQLPLLDIGGDTGKFVAALFAEPEKFQGKVICGATKLYNMEDQAVIISKATGQKVTYSQIPTEMYRSFLPPNIVDELTEMLLYQEEFGYYGENTEGQVKWSTENARGSPITFEKFLEQNPLTLG